MVNQNKSIKDILNKMFNDFKVDFNVLFSIKDELKKLKKRNIFYFIHLPCLANQFINLH